MLGGKPWQEWIVKYGQSHEHPVNRFCHTVGIPLIVLSLPLFIVAIVVGGIWWLPLTLFGVGWIFQFVGHAFEGKPPEFFHDWRFLLVIRCLKSGSSPSVSNATQVIAASRRHGR